MSNRSVAAPVLALLIHLSAGTALAQGAPAAPPAAPAPEATTPPTLPAPPPAAPAAAPAPKAEPAPVSPVPVPPAAAQPSKRPPPPPLAPAGWTAPPEKDQGPDTLFGGRNVTLGGFGGVTPMYTRIKDTNSLIVCGEGALLINHEFSVGVGGCGLVTRIDMSGVTQYSKPEDRVNLGYGGLKLRYHFLSKQVINVAIGATVGAGGVQISPMDHDAEPDDGEDPRMRGSFFVFEPEAAVFVNFTRWARAGLVGSYRIASGLEKNAYVNNSDVTGINAGATIQFGWF